ncbi:MAG: EpsG family protein [Lachnospiraceae bacterium]|nr:EpsG family protein [Lachnospiraceae bacterium]
MQTVALYVFLTAGAVALAAQVKKDAEPGSRQAYLNRLFLYALFMLLYIPAALRIYTGNDYRTYIEHFHDVNVGNYVVTEPGFNAVVKGVFYAFGGEYFMIPFAVFSFITVLFFLKGIYELSAEFYLGIFLFMTLGLYFTSYNTVRYYLALSLVFYSLYHIREKRYIAFVVCVLAAALFHKTALAALLLLPACRLKWKWPHYAGLGLLAVSGLVFREQYMELFVKLYPSYAHEEEYLAGGSLSIINIIRCAAVIALWLYVNKKEGNLSDDIYLKMNVLALIMYSCFYFVPFVSRLGYYLSVSQILILPEIIKASKGRFRSFAYAGTLAAGCAYFAAFLYKAGDIYTKLLPYHSFLADTGEAVWFK